MNRHPAATTLSAGSGGGLAVVPGGSVLLLVCPEWLPARLAAERGIDNTGANRGVEASLSLDGRPARGE